MIPMKYLYMLYTHGANYGFTYQTASKREVNLKWDMLSTCIHLLYTVWVCIHTLEYNIMIQPIDEIIASFISFIALRKSNRFLERENDMAKAT